MGEDILQGARILAVADAFEAMTADRIYRPKLDWGAAVAELRRCSGSQFDSVVVSTFCKVLAEQKSDLDLYLKSLNMDFSLKKKGDKVK